MNKIRKGDEVVILTGRDKKRRGTVIDRVDADHVLVEGINMVKKTCAPKPNARYDRWHYRKDDAYSYFERCAV